MLSWFASRFVGDPVKIGAVAVALVSLWLVSRSGRLGGRPAGLAWAAVAWAGWAVWEALVVGTSPEANIRADLLLLIPAVLAVTVGGLAWAFWPEKQDGPRASEAKEGQGGGPGRGER